MRHVRRQNLPMPHPPAHQSARIVSVNRSLAVWRQISGKSVLTGIGKQAVTGPVAVSAMGLDGDEQADLSVHGGLSKAVYAYPQAHYAFWQTVRAQAGVAAPDAAVPFGLLGENLSIAGLTETDLWIGDRLVLPGCVLAVSEPRFPCFKFNAAMGFAQASKLMSQSGYCGSYLAVIEPGTVSAGDAVLLQAGPRELGLRELFWAKLKRQAS